MNYIKKPDWSISDKEATPEGIYWNRRKFLKALGFLGSSALLSSYSISCADADEVTAQNLTYKDFTGDYSKGTGFEVPERPTTPFEKATGYNNFYEFTTNKERVKVLAKDFKTDPWTLEVSGLVKNPIKLGLEDLHKKYPLEERLYRFRCVEAWAMTVPWLGFPLKKLLSEAEPLEKAKFVRFETVYRPDEMPGQKSQTWYEWPYYEALRLDEAMNDLTLVTVGMYGKILPNQNGAPVRIITPWKYGYKSPKSIVKIELVEEKPGTFWNDLQPKEYGFYSNVNPEVPHPRWSQARERLISTGDYVPTKMFNGYEEQVASLYKEKPSYH